MDTLTPKDRSKRMSLVRSRGNRSTEAAVVQRLRLEGLRGWRRHVEGLPGRPDIWFPTAGVAVFVHGCFWHGCRRCYRAPKSNRSFWRDKLAENRLRDGRTARTLRRAGFGVITVWEHEIANDGWVARLRRRLAGHDG